MGFLSILAAWIVLRRHGPLSALHRDQWLSAWSARINGALARTPAPLRLLVIGALPGALVALIAWLVSGWLGGLVLFAFGLLVLLYSLGRTEVRVELEAYLERWSRGDLEAAYQVARQDLGVGEMAAVDDALTLHAQVRKAVLYAALERWFAVVFWFYWLGPAAALFYRIVQELARSRTDDSGDRRVLGRWLYWIEWLPVRLLGLAFAVTGSFAGCFRVWREQLTAALPGAELLARYEEQALEAVAARADDADFIGRAGAELRELDALLARSAVAWLVLFALLQLVR